MNLLRPALLLLAALGAAAQNAPRDPATLEREGQELAARLRALQPAESVTNTGRLVIRSKTNTVEFPFRVEVVVTATNWTTHYLALDTNAAARDAFRFTRPTTDAAAESFQPFAGSDFWRADLAMAFLHWPGQRLVKKEIRRGQSCDKLESVAPAGQTNGYVRVVSWFDIDTGGPVLCEAYDAAGRQVKEFKPNDFRKVNGQWQVSELEMRNVRTGSRSFLRFDLPPRQP